VKKRRVRWGVLLLYLMKNKKKGGNCDGSHRIRRFTTPYKERG
jgi:hypothetical protein